MRRLCMALLVVTALVLSGAPARAEELPADAVASPVGDLETGSQLPEFLLGFDDGGACTGVPDTLPGIFDFTEACAAHDACYAEGVDRLACDLAFREDMRAACESQHPDALDGRRYACFGFADLYFFGVRLFGEFSFG